MTKMRVMGCVRCGVRCGVSVVVQGYRIQSVQAGVRDPSKSPITGTASKRARVRDPRKRPKSKKLGSDARVQDVSIVIVR